MTLVLFVHRGKDCWVRFQLCLQHMRDRLLTSKAGFHFSPSLERTALGSLTALEIQIHKRSLEVRASHTFCSKYILYSDKQIVV